MKSSKLRNKAALGAIWIGCAVGALANVPNTATTVTAATGTITQINYGDNGEVQGFLIGASALLSFASNVCGGVGSLGVAGNSVTYSGSASTTTAGFAFVRVTSFTNNTSAATYTAPSFSRTTYGPTTGTVTQLNYTNSGAIDGFVYTPSGSTTSIFVATGPRPSTTLTTLLTVNATASVTGTTSAQQSACSPTGTLETVDASSLVIGGQTLTISTGGHDGPGGHH